MNLSELMPKATEGAHGKEEGEGDSHAMHVHACLSAAARLVEALHASDAHGASMALAGHHDAYRKMMGYDDKSEE